MYIYIYIICVYIFIYIWYISIYLDTYKSTETRICIYAFTHKCIHTNIFIRTHFQFRACAIWFSMYIHIYERTYIHECIPARLRLLCRGSVIVLGSLCYMRSCYCYLLCSALVRMCLAAAIWQSKNGLLATLPPSQSVAGLVLVPLLVASCCLAVEMRLAAAYWQSQNCLLRYYRSKLSILVRMCCGSSAVLEWAVSFQTPFHICSRPGPPMYCPWPLPRQMA